MYHTSSAYRMHANFCGMYVCKCPVGEDFRDFISCKALHMTLPEDSVNCLCGIPL